MLVNPASRILAVKYKLSLKKIPTLSFFVREEAKRLKLGSLATKGDWKLRLLSREGV